MTFMGTSVKGMKCYNIIRTQKKYFLMRNYSNLMPKVKKDTNTEEGMDIENYFDIEDFIMENNFFFCFGEINDLIVNTLINKYLYSSLGKNSHDSYKILINSPGGDIITGLALYDIFTLNKSKLNTVGLGIAASMAAVLLASGEKRVSFPNTRIMIHQPLGGVRGNVTEIEIQAKELIYHKNNINYLLSKLTGQSILKIEKDTTRDAYLTPIEAVEYGLIDDIISSNRNISLKKVSYLKISNASMINWGDIGKFI